MLAYTVHCVPIPLYTCMWQRITLYLPPCLYIPMHSHNLSLVEICVIKLSYLAYPCSTSHHSLCLSYYADFKPLFANTMLSPYGVREHALILSHTLMHVYTLCKWHCTILFHITCIHTHMHTHTHVHTHTHTHTHTQTQHLCTMTYMATL